MGCCFLLRTAWKSSFYFRLPCAVAWMRGVPHGTQLLVQMGSCEILPKLAWNYDPPDLSLPRS
jgi:hypothetical protein